VIDDTVVLGPDGLARCPWSDSSDDYREYHDGEWGRPVRGDDAIFERLCLEAFQAGLSWITILRRRDGFRRAFADFDAAAVAAFDEGRVDALVADARIIRHRGKVEAVVSNARILRGWQAEEGVGVLDDLVWSYAAPGATSGSAPGSTMGAGPTRMSDVPTETPESRDLARRLRERGWRWIGPTSAYAAMQAMGVVDDHLAGCHVRGAAPPSHATQPTPS